MRMQYSFEVKKKGRIGIRIVKTKNFRNGTVRIRNTAETSRNVKLSPKKKIMLFSSLKDPDPLGSETFTDQDPDADPDPY